MKFAKVKLKDGTEYNIVPDMFSENNGVLSIYFVLEGEVDLAKIDEATCDKTNISKITYIDTQDSQMDIKNGFVNQTTCRKERNYPAGTESVVVGSNPVTGESYVQQKTIYKDIAIVTLEKEGIVNRVENVEETLYTIIPAILNMGVN